MQHKTHLFTLVSTFVLGSFVFVPQPVQAQEATESVAAQFQELNERGNALFRQPFQGRSAVQTYRDTSIDQALEAYREAMNLPGISNLQKIRLYGSIANCYLEKKDVERANQELQQALALPGLTHNEQLVAKLQYARVLARQLEVEKAKALFDEVLAEPRLPQGENKGRIVERERVRLEGNVQQRVAYLRKQGWTTHAILRSSIWDTRAVDRALRAELAREILADETVTNTPQRYDAYRSIMIDLMAREDLDAAKALFHLYAGEFWNISVFDEYRDNDRWQQVNPPEAFRFWIGETLLKQELSEADQRKAYRHLLVGARRLYRPDKAAEAIQQILTLDDKLEGKDKMKPEERQSLQFELVVLLAGNDPARAARAVADRLQQAGDLDVRAQMALLLTSGRHAMTWRYYDVAERLLNDHNQLLADEPKPSIPVAYISNGPRDIQGFLNSEWFRNEGNRGVLNRPYTGNLKLLAETDTASVGRVLTQADGSAVQLDTAAGSYGADIQRPAEGTQASTHTVFTASCDQNGVYLFFYVPVEAERLQQMRNGFGRIGSFETYLAEGFYDAYTTLIFNPAPDALLRVDGKKFPSQYPNRHFRPKVEGQNLKYDSQIVEGGVAVLLFFDWEGFLRLPQNGDKWSFEAIHFERGGSTWGGSRSVHWKDTMGELVFENLTPQHRTAIQHRLLSKAKAAYTREKQARVNGYIEFWMDHQLGDQAFYDAVVKPLVDKYDAYAARIQANMTDEEIHEVYREAYAFMIHSRFEIEELRRAYVLEQMTTIN